MTSHTHEKQVDTPYQGRFSPARRTALVGIVLHSAWLGAMATAPLAQSAPPEALASVPCLIEAYETVHLATPVGGIVDDVMVDRGDVVAAGDVIARLDSRVEQIARDLARARADDRTNVLALEAKVEFLTLLSERRNTLAKRNALPDTQAKETALELAVAIQELERAGMAMDMAELEVAQAEALLAQKALTSPIAGVVTERLANKGEFRNGETDIVTIARIDQLRVEAYAPISHYPRLSIGQEVQVIPEPPLDQPRSATIRVIDRVFDAATATFGLRMELENPDLSLPAGLRCTLHFPGA